MSVLYSSIAFAASVVAWRQNKGSVAHSIREGSTPDRAFGIMNALGGALLSDLKTSSTIPYNGAVSSRARCFLPALWACMACLQHERQVLPELSSCRLSGLVE